MNILKKIVLPILLATVWIGLSEFTRNEFLIKANWIAHYQSMGLVFPASMINGAVWGIWSLLFACFIFVLSGKFSLLETTVISWFAGFVLMWVVTGNLGVLPFSILYLAVPLSIFESFGAGWIFYKFRN
jgi:hypothetical protein